MKRILALIMVLAMVFAFAACKSKDDGATTTDPSSAGGEVIDNGDGSTVPADASAADSTDTSNDASEVSTDASGKPVEAPSQAAGSQGGSQGGAQTGPDGQQYYDADYKVVDEDDQNK